METMVLIIGAVLFLIAFNFLGIKFKGVKFKKQKELNNLILKNWKVPFLERNKWIKEIIIIPLRIVFSLIDILSQLLKRIVKANIAFRK